jgi:hypothetical protein
MLPLARYDNHTDSQEGKQPQTPASNSGAKPQEDCEKWTTVDVDGRYCDFFVNSGQHNILLTAQYAWRKVGTLTPHEQPSILGCIAEGESHQLAIYLYHSADG